MPIFSASPYQRPLPRVNQRSHTAQARLVIGQNAPSEETPHIGKMNVSGEVTGKPAATEKESNNTSRNGPDVDSVACRGTMEVDKAIDNNNNQPQPIPMMA